MPKINRIRIVNFSYNNDSRHILDETFNFHGGENALLNLANGGGKSVLVQLFLQPVVPRARIQGRNIAGFFRKKKLPTYVMIEWKLDGAGGYLLTGIGIVPAEASGGGEEKNRIRYFTFTSKYTGANSCDIAHIAFVNRNGGVLEVMPFREAREMMAEKERKDPFTFGYFPEDDGERYAKFLAEFGIAQDEWRNVIAKINDSEGGLEEIFQKYKKSGQLLNDWIIKTVEKAMFRNRSEAHRLEEMLESLVKEVVENERFTLEKQLLDGFLGTFGEQVDALAELLKGLDEQKKLAGKLAALFSCLTVEIGSLQEKYEGNEQEIESCKVEEQRVQLEERSHDYWLRKSDYEKALERLTTAEEMSKKTEASLQNTKLRGTIMQAARLAGEICRKEAELSGIEEKLSTSKELYDKDGRVSSLEYSLKILYEQTLESVAATLTRLYGEKAEKKRLKDVAEEELRAVEGQKSRLDGEKGRLEERKKTFEDYEKEVCRKLGISLMRNLLGEMDAADIKKTGTMLEKVRDILNKKGERLENEKTTCMIRRQDIDNELKELQTACAEEKTALNGIDRDIREYEKKEQEIRGILDRHGFDFDIRFDRERLAAAFGQLVKNLEGRLEEAARIRDDATEALLSLKNGRLHTPEELASVFAGLDIQYDTGETYLRHQPPERRRGILEGNPFLPYAFIMARSDMDRVANSLNSMTMRRVIPLIAYEDLGTTLESDGRVARTRDGIAFACLYEGRMFDDEGMAKLVAELEQKKNKALEQHGHFKDAHTAAVSDRAVCVRFDYRDDYLYGLEKKKNEATKRLQDMESRMSALEEEKRTQGKRQAELEQQIEKLREALQKAGEDIVTFSGFIEKDKDYQDCRGKLVAVINTIAGLETRKAELADSLKNLQADSGGLAREIWQAKKEQQDIKERYGPYKDAPKAETVEGSAAELEERLKALKEKYTGEIGLLEKRKDELTRECDGLRKDLEKLGLKEEEYAGVVYDELAAERISGEITRLEGLLKERRQEEKDAASGEGAAKNALDNALNEVNRLGAGEPLPPGEIKGDFRERRKRARLRVKELEAGNKKISGQIRRYDKIRENIERLVEPGVTEPEKGFVPEQDITAQAAGFERSFIKIERENRESANKLRNNYTELKVIYQDKNLNFDNIFKGLDPLWDKAGTEFDDFYYLYERMSLHAEKLADLIRIYEAQLANLEQNKKDMAQQSFYHGMGIYEEIQWISDNSKVRLQGRARPVQMLKVDLQLDNKEAAIQRMKEYIEECITKVREETRQEKREDEVRKTVAKLMSSRELLNVFLGTPNIPVSVFKIDLNMQNSRLKLWEDAVRENSGGEKFVVFFSVLSALMTYTRARAMEAAGDTDTRVLVMDNPFGPISSEHLLNPLFEIARKHRTQLICLSDLKQNSIMNCFNLIYMLKVRTSAIGSNEYLKFEEIIQDESTVQNDERLEKAVFRASDVRQLSLFDA